jgi:AAHS family 4-hydroxybenzoate transporter-like MFS transporter
VKVVSGFSRTNMAGTTLDSRESVDDRPISSEQLLGAAMCALIVFVDGFDAQAMGYVAPALMDELRISRGVLGPVISSGLVGMMIGALVCGSLADRIGRRPVLIGCVVIFGIGSLLTATADSVSALAAFRLLTGLGMGGAMPNAIALTSEIMPVRRRGAAVTTMICGFSLGAAVGGFVAAAIIPGFGWQAVFVIGGAAPVVIAVAALRWLGESPRFLRIRDSADAGGTLARFPVTELFTGGRALPTILIWIVYFMNLLNLYFLNSWLPTIMSDAGIPVSTAIRLTTLFQVGGIGGALVLGAVLDRYFSFWVLAACYAWAAISVLLIGMAGASPLVLGITIACAGLGIIGGQNGGHAVTSGFYPTAIRSTGVGWALGVGRVGSIVGPVLGGMLLARGTSVRQVFWAAAIPSLIATLAAVGVAVKSRHGEVSHGDH